MEDRSSPSEATSLDALPLAAQNFLAFEAIATALGFTPSAISQRVIAAPTRGSTVERLLYAIVTSGGKEFTVELGAPVPEMAAWIARGVELWACAAPAARDALYDRSRFFQGNCFGELLSALERAGLPPPIAPGLVVSRLERMGIAAAVRRTGGLEGPPAAAAPPPRRSATAIPPRPVGPARFEVGPIGYLSEARVPDGELAPMIQRHASGDWGESRYADENEAALGSGRPILSVFRSAVGEQILVITFSRPMRTSVWVHAGLEWSEEVLLDLVCRHVGTGRRSEIRPSAQGTLYAVPLVGRQEPHETGHVERAALALLAVLGGDPANEVPYRPEQMLRTLWRAVEGVDLRPIQRSGQRVAVDAPAAVCEAAFERCMREHIGAWFAVSWEARLA